MDDKQHINRQPTSAEEGSEESGFDIAGNAREKVQDPSPDDRDRGERSDAEPAGAEDAARR